MRRYLAIIYKQGVENADARRDIPACDGDGRACHLAEGELRRHLGDGCEVVDVVVRSLSPTSYARRAGLLYAEQANSEEVRLFSSVGNRS